MKASPRRLFAQSVAALALVLAPVASQAQSFDLVSPKGRQDAIAQFAAKDATNRKAVLAYIQRTGARESWVDSKGRHVFLARIDDDGYPEYWASENVNAAISTAANLVRNTAPYNVNGAGVRIGLWEAGAVPRLTHQDFVGALLSVAPGQISTRGTHATHVAGTIIGQGLLNYNVSGVTTTLMGMSPGVTMIGYDATNDDAEMTALAAATPLSNTGVQLSNHSYGALSGWDTYDYTSGTSTITLPAWYGTWGPSESRNFGNYNSAARDWDAIGFAAKYYLVVRSAGNDRGDPPPGNGATFIYFNPDPVVAVYDSSIHPGPDGGADGYDTIPTRGVAKNILTVGAANAAVSGGLRSVPAGTIASFSSRGPADDGRVKPDIVANGVGLPSMIGSNDTGWVILSGTSMSSPNACGSAALLIQHYRNKFPGADLLASTLKALIIHTADDIGNAGPDYIYGWGYMNTKAAADIISQQAANPAIGNMREGSMAVNTQVDRYTFAASGSTPIRATLCWTDPAGSATTILDNPNPRLVNNLDVRIETLDGSTIYRPFVLDKDNPSSAATTGVNNVDNVEQVLVSSLPAGNYRVVVSMSGALSSGPQAYSLILSGQVAPSAVNQWTTYE